MTKRQERLQTLKDQQDIAALRGQVATLREALLVAFRAADAIMHSNGYLSKDAMGTENSAWLGPRLSNITVTARAALAATADTKPQEARHE